MSDDQGFPGDTVTRKRTTPLSDEAPHPGHCSPELRARILGDAPYFSGLSATALDAVNDCFRAYDYPADTSIYHEGEPAKTLFLVAHGKVKLLQHSHDGDPIVLDLLSQGALFGGLAILGSRHHPQTAVAQTDCCLLSIAAPDFQRLLRTYPEITLRVLDQVARDLEAAHDTIRRLSTVPVEARIAATLLRLADRLGEPDGDGVLIQSPLSQQDLAAMVGSTTETVSRIISRLRRSGYLDTGRQWVRIRDRASLLRLSEKT